MRHRSLGNPIDKAWLLGWDDSIRCVHKNPYSRRPQREAYERGRTAGLRSNARDIAVMERIVAQRKKRAQDKSDG